MRQFFLATACAAGTLFLSASTAKVQAESFSMFPQQAMLTSPFSFDSSPHGVAPPRQVVAYEAPIRPARSSSRRRSAAFI